MITGNKVFDNGTGKVDIERAMEDFGRYLPTRMRTEKPVIHISLNPHPDDKLTDTDLEQLARTYMERLGYGEQPYLVFKHEDTGRDHLHIVSIRVGADGKRLNNDYIHRRSLRIITALEKEFGLRAWKESKQPQGEAVKQVNVESGNVKHQVANVLRGLHGKYRYQTLGEYRALLSLYHVTVEEVRGEVKGKEYRGLIYAATDDKGHTCTTPIKASRFGKEYGYAAFDEWCKASAVHIKEKRNATHTKATILDAVGKSGSKSEFVAQLKTRGIDVVFRESDKGRIYGATFIDHHTGCVLNGSRMGKSLSANALEARFNAHVAVDRRDTPQAQTFDVQPKDTPLTHGDSEGGGFSGLGLMTTGSTGIDPEEEQFRQQMQKKKKKRQRRIW